MREKGLFLILIVVVIAFCYSGMMGKARDHQTKRELCRDAGYFNYEYLDGVGYCVGKNFAEFDSLWMPAEAR